jgi:hypothetical protein
MILYFFFWEKVLSFYFPVGKKKKEKKNGLRKKKKISYHEMPDLLPRFLVRDPRLPVGGHHPTAGKGPHGPAQVGLAGSAHAALAAKGLVARDHRVARFAGRHPFPDGLDGARRLVAEDAGEQPFWVVAVEGVGVGVAEGGGDDLMFLLLLLLLLKNVRLGFCFSSPSKKSQKPQKRNNNSLPPTSP